MKRIVLLYVVMAGCHEPPTIDFAMAPLDAHIYKLPQPMDVEGWVLGIRMNETTPQQIERVEITVLHDDDELLREVLKAPALAAYRRKSQEDPAWLLRDLQQQLPRSLDANRLEVRMWSTRGAQAHRTFPLIRYQQRNAISLPVAGCWFVAAGHELGVEHRRWYNRAHFAIDLVKVDAAGRPHNGAGDLASYYAFGQAILAPADGVITLAADHHPDNPPGTLGEPGTSNFILLDAGGGEQIKLGHIRQGSLRVRPGERVRRGQKLGEVGNSGISDAPHLHMHLQHTLFDASGVVQEEQPLPLMLSSYRATSNLGVALPVSEGRPRRGEFLCNP